MCRYKCICVIMCMFVFMCIYIRVWQNLTSHGIGMYAYTTVIHTKWCRQQSFLNYLVQGHCKDIALGPQDAPNRPPRGPQDVAKCTGPADAQKFFVQLLGGLVIVQAQQMHKFFRAIAGAGDCHPVNLCMHFGGFSRKLKAKKIVGYDQGEAWCIYQSVISSGRLIIKRPELVHG